MPAARLPRWATWGVNIARRSGVKLQSRLTHLIAYSLQSTPELNGAVSRVAADVSQDQISGAHYYTVQIVVPESEVTRLARLRIVPGMPADIFLQTNSRTVISFLTRPMRDQVMRAFREQ